MTICISSVISKALNRTIYRAYMLVSAIIAALIPDGGITFSDRLGLMEGNMLPHFYQLGHLGEYTCLLRVISKALLRTKYLLIGISLAIQRTITHSKISVRTCSGPQFYS